MKTFYCNCGAIVYFENSQCVSCWSELGWCPACSSVCSLLADGNGNYTCGNPSCGAILEKCFNYSHEGVCNRCCLASFQEHDTHVFCDYCRFNDTIPDLSIAGNRDKWGRIEVAKRQLLFTLDLLRLPYGDANDGVSPPLSFDFKEDAVRKRRIWWNMNKEEQVYTGHHEGKITINIREADPVEREKARVSFGEAHRTVIGHFRHEIGHYFWDLLVKDKCEHDSIAMFGDHYNPDYATALEHYYDNGPIENWNTNYISAYATMHPWEDFAESFAAYLNIVTVLDTAYNSVINLGVDPLMTDFTEMANQYTNIGLVLNEMNRAMGLKDYMPVVHTPAIMAKIEFIHTLLRKAARP